MMSTRHSFRLPMLCAVGVLAALPVLTIVRSLAQDAPKDDTPYTWQLTYKKGDVQKFRSSANITGPLPMGGDLTGVVKLVLKEETKDVTDSGDAKVVRTVESNKTVFNGQEIPDNPHSHPTVTQTVSKNGLLVSQDVAGSGDQPEQLINLQAMLSNTPVPDKPVKIGDTWKTDVPNLVLKDKSKVTITSTLDGTETIGGIKALRIKMQTAIPMKAGTDPKNSAKVDSTYFVDPKAGRVLRANYVVENLALDTPAGSITLKVNTRIALIIPGYNDKDDAEDKAAPDKPENGK